MPLSSHNIILSATKVQVCA